jgi:hypothetical protein
MDTKIIAETLNQAGFKTKMVNENKLIIEGKEVRVVGSLLAIDRKTYLIRNSKDLVSQLWSKRVLSIQSFQIDNLAKQIKIK